MNEHASLSSIANLVSAIRAQDGDITWVDIADIVWLAASLAPRPHTERSPEVLPVQPPAGERRTPPGGSQSGPSTGKVETRSERSRTLYPADDGPSVSQGDATPVRVPAVGALPNALRIGRALRPLARPEDSPFERMLDEEATIRLAADLDLWMPAFRPAPTRSFELALVTDEAASIAPWLETIQEFRRLLERLGAFRDVRDWRLRAEPGPSGALRIRPHGRLARAWRSPLELRDPRGRRLVLIASDCVSEPWRDGRFRALIGELGGTQPVAILQLLPQSLWHHTGLGRAARATARTRRPGGVASGVELGPYSPRLAAPPGRRKEPTHTAEQRPVAVPVLPLEPAPLAAWARMVAATGDASATVYILPEPKAPAGADGEEKRTGDQPMAPRSRVERFARTASRPAQELAACLSAAPLQLPVMRLIQHVMVPESRQVHLAEVLLGGLMYLLPGATDSPQALQFEFHPGVRDQLISRLEFHRAVDAYNVVTRYIAGHFGQARDFQALLRDPSGLLQMRAEAAARPIAEIAALLLKRLGGPYTRLAEDLVATQERESASPGESGAGTEAVARDEDETRAEPQSHVPIRVECPECLLSFGIPPIQVGAAVECPACRTVCVYDDVPLGPEGRYRLRKFLAAGAFTAVVEGWDSSRREAVKVTFLFPPEALARMPRGADLGAGLTRIRHPHILPIYDIVPEPLAIVQPLVEVTTLQREIQVNQPGTETAIRWVIAASEAADYLHQHGIVHRNLHPTTLVIDRAKSILVTLQPERTLFGDNNLPLPVRSFTSPELRGPRSRDWHAAVDIYSLGAILYALVTGDLHPELPPRPASPGEPDIDDELRAICHKATSFRPEDRYTSAAEFARALRDYQVRSERTTRGSDLVPAGPGQPDVFLSGSSRIPMKLIPAGEFAMGCESVEDERPVKRVLLDRPFLLSVYPVTQILYRQVVGLTPFSLFRGLDQHPVDSVSWLEAVMFCNRLSEKDGLLPYYEIAGSSAKARGGTGYRLPTEAEWEYACRGAGTVEASDQELEAGLSERAWFQENADGSTHEVGNLAESFGLFDMRGNVWEWCWDWYGPYPAPNSRDAVELNPEGPDTGRERVLRGGCFSSSARGVRSTSRMSFDPGMGVYQIGFRLARDLTR